MTREKRLLITLWIAVICFISQTTLVFLMGEEYRQAKKDIVRLNQENQLMFESCWQMSADDGESDSQ